MTTNSQRIDFEKQLSQIIELFDTEAKPKLSEKLFGVFRLSERKKFSSQLEKLLHRKLTSDESFKIGVLETAFEYHGGNAESEDDSYEEEEEEE